MLLFSSHFYSVSFHIAIYTGSKSQLIPWCIRYRIRKDSEMDSGCCLRMYFTCASIKDAKKPGSRKSFYPKRQAHWILMFSSCIQGSPFISPCLFPNLSAYTTLPLNSLFQRRSDATKSTASSHPSSAIRNAPRDSVTDLESSTSHIDQEDVSFFSCSI